MPSHLVRDMVEDGDLEVEKVDTKDNVADLTTKPPESRPQMVRLFSKLNLEIRA